MLGRLGTLQDLSIHVNVVLSRMLGMQASRTDAQPIEAFR